MGDAAFYGVERNTEKMSSAVAGGKILMTLQLHFSVLLVKF